MKNQKFANFYTDLPVFNNFFDFSNRSNYRPLPNNWLIAVTDIIDSTSAIENGRYRDINILGASPIVGILNVAGQHSVPYTFGGDGSIFCIPPNLQNEAITILSSCRFVSVNEYSLNMRAALVPVSYIRSQNQDIQVARYAASDHYSQAIFSGGGISYIEQQIKTPALNEYQIESKDKTSEVDFSGLECRWKEVKQSGKEVITLLVKSNPEVEDQSKVHQAVMQEMRNIFGFDDETNPIKSSRLSMAFSISELMREVKIRTAGKGFLSKLWYLLKMEFEIVVGKVFMFLNRKSSETDWSLYKSDMVKNSDSRKYDDMLRLVISGSGKERERFEKFLEQKYKQGKLAYGMHVSDAAVITCMVFQYHRDHVHFVDGKNGGYVNASKGLKRRLDILSSRD